jgi:hypothetical protein
METEKFKRCRCCDQLLPVTEFADRRYRSKTKPNGWRHTKCHQCRTCVNKRHKEWRDSHKQYWITYRMNNPQYK